MTWIRALSSVHIHFFDLLVLAVILFTKTAYAEMVECFNDTLILPLSNSNDFIFPDWTNYTTDTAMIKVPYRIHSNTSVEGSGNLGIQQDPPAGYLVAGLMELEVTIYVTEMNSSEMGNCSFILATRDLTPPTVTIVGIDNDYVSEDPSISAIAVDNVDPEEALAVTIKVDGQPYIPGMQFDLGYHSVTVTAVDGSGNVGFDAKLFEKRSTEVSNRGLQENGSPTPTTAVPTTTPSMWPTSAPTAVPTSTPSTWPTSAPTAAPTATPTTPVPTLTPTVAPTTSLPATPAPMTVPPTKSPTTGSPTLTPTTSPISTPQSSPYPSPSPTRTPSSEPTPHTTPISTPPSLAPVTCPDKQYKFKSSISRGIATKKLEEIKECQEGYIVEYLNANPTPFLYGFAFDYCSDDGMAAIMHESIGSDDTEIHIWLDGAADDQEAFEVCNPKYTCVFNPEFKGYVAVGESQKAYAVLAGLIDVASEECNLESIRSRGISIGNQGMGNQGILVSYTFGQVVNGIPEYEVDIDHFDNSLSKTFHESGQPVVSQVEVAQVTIDVTAHAMTHLVADNKDSNLEYAFALALLSDAAFGIRVIAECQSNCGIEMETFKFDR